MKSHASASSHPPPSAKPLTAAMTGKWVASSAWPTRCPRSAKSFACTAVIALIAAMSAPAAKALSPAPVRIAHRTPASRARSRKTRPSSVKSSSFRALSLSARLRRIVTTWSSRSTRTVLMFLPCPYVLTTLRRGGRSLPAFVVHIKPTPALAAEPAGGDQVPQQRGGSILVVAEVAMQDVGDREHRVETDQIAQLEGAHRMVQPEARSRVDVRGGADALFEGEASLAEHRHEDPVHQEPRRVQARDRGLSHRARERDGQLVRILAGLQGAHDLDEPHERRGVHEVHPDHAIR